jgi:hypothetical protein
MAQVVGITKKELNDIFISDQKAEKDFNRRMLQLEPDARAKYGSYEDYIKDGWEKYEDGLWSHREVFRGFDGRPYVDSEIHNAKRNMGSIQREILLRIYAQARKNKITPDKMIDFILQKAEEEYMDNYRSSR